ncbi:MAG: flippase-like domain-containing protein [Selenomonas sp.]|uniref:lysylphosphatidylglycerol synthase transmembrane domain-containing protein n=1 Tax=Selenomonas sp. TaxID=2053611 RepID=UPI0025E21391|nr:lysylphosphatidylglycerol synthase transmembrane domain-containing protein [Selenomonas sp.]MCR5758554.1 flippase-like domain-containing protein [Selenomonas sp.]
MSKVYKRFMVLILLVVIISGVVIYTTVDINTLKNLDRFQSWSIGLAILAVGLGMFFDGSRLMHMVKISHEKITLYQAVQVVFGNYFLALLTPGATGGAVAQLMFLRHAGVPTGKATVLVIVRTLMSIFFLVLCMPFIFLHDKGILPGISNQTLMAVTLTAFVVIVAIVVGARLGTLDYFVIRFTRHMRNSRRRKVFAFYRDTKCAIALLLQSPWKMILVFLESGLNLLCIYAIVPCLLLGLGVTDADWYTVMGRMIFLNMLLYFTPTPGGSGVAEGGFVLLFSETVPAGTVGIIAVCWRLIAEYIPFLIGLYYTLTVFGRDFLSRQLNK